MPQTVRQHGLREELLTIWRQLNMAALFVAHDIQEAVYVAQRVRFIRGAAARIIFDDTVPGSGTVARSDPGLQPFAKHVADAL